MTPGPDEELAQIVDTILAASRALVAVSARSIADASDVTLSQYRMLVVLSQSPSNLSTLAKALDVAPSTALRMVDRLVEAGFVDRAVPPDNRRETHLSLSSAGRRTVQSVTRRRQRDLQSVVERIPADQRPDLARSMAQFASAADTIWPVTAATSVDRQV